MKPIPLVRAEYLRLIAETLREIGDPVERRLARTRLPPDVEETPDAMVSLNLVLDFCDLNARREGICNFGWAYARGFRYGNLGPDFLGEARSVPNGLARLKRFLAHAAKEDTVARLGLRREGHTVRVVCDLVPPVQKMMAYTEWIQIQVLLSIVRSATRPGLVPTGDHFHIALHRVPHGARGVRRVKDPLRPRTYLVHRAVRLGCSASEGQRQCPGGRNARRGGPLDQ